MKKKLIVLLLAIVAFLGMLTSCNETPELKGKMGIDVSAYQGEIDWGKVYESGIKFAMIRCGYRTSGEGEIHIDKRFFDNVQGANEAGVDVGLYFFSQAVNEKEAIEEARVCLGLAKFYDIKFHVAFDMENIDEEDRIAGLSKEEKTNIALAFCKEISAGGLTPMIYGNNHWLANEFDLEILKDYELWLADYDKKSNGEVPYKIWQYSSEGNVKGIDHNVDLNLMVE